MKKLIKKMAEVYARNTTNSCGFWLIHATKAPRSLIQK